MRKMLEKVFAQVYSLRSKSVVSVSLSLISKELRVRKACSLLPAVTGVPGVTVAVMCNDMP